MWWVSAAFAGQVMVWDVTAPDGARSTLIGVCEMAGALDEVTGGVRIEDARAVFIETHEPDPMKQMTLLDGLQRASAVTSREEWYALVRSTTEVPAPMLDRMGAGASAAWMLVRGEGSLRSQLSARAGERLRGLESTEEQHALILRQEPQMGPYLTRAGLLADSDQHRALCGRGDLSVIPADELRIAEVERRNPAWVAALTPELAQGGVIVAVAPLHMVGPSGLPALLADAGYKVKRAKAKLDVEVAGIQLPSGPPPAPLPDAMTDEIAGRLCASEMVQRCFASPSCVETVRADLQSCALQSADPDKLGACAGSGLVFDAMIGGRFDPSCH